MRHDAVINDDKYDVKIDLKIPHNPNATTGVILCHGGFVNRKSLSRETNSLADSFSDKLNAYVITPDFFGETIYHADIYDFQDTVDIVKTCVEYLVDDLNLDTIYGFGHSLGGHILANSLAVTDNIRAISTYGSPMVSSHLFEWLVSRITSHPKMRDKSVSFRSFFQLFDSETRRYFSQVMVRNSGYSKTISYRYDVNVIKSMIPSCMNHIDKIRISKTPALILTGSNDSVMMLARMFSKFGVNRDNLHYKVIEGCHITPCREEKEELDKFNTILNFYNETRF